MKKQAEGIHSDAYPEDVLEKHIHLIENSKDPFPPRFGKKEYIFVGVVVLVCLAGLIFGAQLA